MRVLRRPLSSWLLLSMMAVLVFEPDAPLLVHQVAMLIALVPVLRLIPPDARPLLGPWPYVAAGLYLLERIAFLFEDVDADVVVCGHTHTQFERTIAGKRVLNSGSVGMPYEDEPGAYWTLDLEHRFTPYEGAALSTSREDAVTYFTDRGL